MSYIMLLFPVYKWGHWQHFHCSTVNITPKKKPHKKTVELINEFIKVAEYKINMPNASVFVAAEIYCVSIH